MEVIKEGTHTYLLKQIEYRTPVYDESVVHTQNESWDYYLSVEYEILKRNELKTLVSAQLREKDEEKSLLFDITGKRPLKRQGKERAFSQKECEKILQNMSNMIQEVEDYMLDLNCIELRPEYIYEDSKGEIQSDKFIQEKELQNRTQMIKTEVDWEAEGDWESGTEGTTILNYGNESEKEDGKICHPMLRDMELGIIYVIKNCPFYIGSAEGVNHLHIQDKTVSREHAVILEDIYEGDGQGYILRDMGSTNGTWLNGKKIKRGNQEQLEDGAVIRFAKKEYEFLIQDI